MKRTGPTKDLTKKLVLECEVLARKTKKKFWKALGKQLKAPARIRAKKNLWQLEKLAKKFKNKSFVVPGKVLGTGSLNSKISVFALSFSQNAKNKIEAKKGTAMNLKELIEKKPALKELMIAK